MNYSLLHGDCIQKMNDIPDSCVNLVLCDPPYGITASKWDSIIPFDVLWDHLIRITQPDSAIIMTASQPFTSLLVCSNLSMFKSEWIWSKNKGSGHLNAKRMPMKFHESVLVFYNKPPTYNPQKTTNHKPMNNAKSTGKSDNYGKQVTTISGGATDRHPRNIIDIPVMNNDGSNGVKLHPTQKPVALMEYFIKTYSNENDVVLDFCMGSATTGVACINTNRNFIGIESDDIYFEHAKNRIEGLL